MRNLVLRIPGWTDGVTVRINNEVIETQSNPVSNQIATNGYSPYDGQYLTLPGPFREGDKISLTFNPTIKTRQVNPRVGLGQADTAHFLTAPWFSVLKAQIIREWT